MATSEEYEKWAKENIEYSAGFLDRNDEAALYHILSAVLTATTSITMKMDMIIELLERNK